MTKDCLTILDDFVTTGNRFDVDRSHAKAETVIRKIRNHDHRGRLRADLSLRPEMRCNGQPCGSGEERPRGFSLQAGMVFVEFAPGDVDLKLLTVAQKRAADGVYEKAMSAYIRYLAWRLKGMRKDFPDRCEKYREAWANTGGHLRTPDAMANLEAALSVFLDFAQSTMSITLEERVEYGRVARKALEQVAEAQTLSSVQQDPTTRFLQLLGALLYSHRAHLDDGNGGMPASNAGVLGWKKQDSSFGGAYKPYGPRIGWVNGRELCLNSDLAYTEVQKLAIQQGSPIPIDVNTLWRRMGQKDLILRSEGEGKYSMKRQMPDGTRQRFRVILMETLINGSKLSESPISEKPEARGSDAETSSDHVH